MTVNLDDLNPAQRDAATTVQGPLLVLAGAGSGKTRVLTYRIAHLVGDHGVSPAEILAITFTNKAAAEMRARIGESCGVSIRSMWVMTFHAMCVRMLRADAERLDGEDGHPGYDHNFTIYDTDDTKRMLRSVMSQLEIDDKRYPVNGVLNRISSAKGELISAAEFEAKAVTPMDKVTAKVYKRYRVRMREANAMDFDDLLVNAHRLLADHDEVRAAYQGRFRHISVDEYQDTNHAQYRIVGLLAPHDLIAEKNRSLMVVGDDDQSIYSWRGADIRNILEFERDYPEATVIRLEQNYRSTETILAAANAVVANNSGRKPKTLWTANAGGEAISRYYASDERDEARFVAAEVERIVRAGSLVCGLRDLLPDERPEPRARGFVAAGRRAVSDRGRDAIFRARGDPRCDGLRALGEQPRRRGCSQAHHQHAEARHRQVHGGATRVRGDLERHHRSMRHCTGRPRASGLPRER